MSASGSRNIAQRRAPGAGLLGASVADSATWLLVVGGAVAIAAGAIASAARLTFVGGGLVAALLAAVAVGVVVVVLLQSRTFERRLRSARARFLEARDDERRRIQRDLHDSAQQRLVSVRIHLELLAEELPAPRQELVHRLGRDVEAALAEIRSVTQDGRPELLVRCGVAAALREAASCAPIPVSVEANDFDRYHPRVERALYFCSVEAMQNIVKHAGPQAEGQIRLHEERGRVIFEVEDSGAGFDPRNVDSGNGLTGIADRVATLGGSVAVDSQPGHGTRVRGVIPID